MPTEGGLPIDRRSNRSSVVFAFPHATRQLPGYNVTALADDTIHCSSCIPLKNSGRRAEDSPGPRVCWVRCIVFISCSMPETPQTFVIISDIMTAQLSAPIRTFVSPDDTSAVWTCTCRHFPRSERGRFPSECDDHSSCSFVPHIPLALAAALSQRILDISCDFGRRE